MMESKNLKPRILDALDVIGTPATAREIASVGAIDERIHSRIKELVDNGDLVRLQEVGQPIRYALTTMVIPETHEETQKMNEPEIMTKETPMPKPERPTYVDIYEGIEAQKQSVDGMIFEYISRVLDADPIYLSMIEASEKLKKVLDEIALCGMK